MGNAILPFPAPVDVERCVGTRGAPACSHSTNEVSDPKQPLLVVTVSDNGDRNFCGRNVRLMVIFVLVIVLLIIGGAKTLTAVLSN